MKYNRSYFMCYFLLFAIAIGRYACQSPIIYDLPAYILASESFAIGSILFSFTATHPLEDEYIDIIIYGKETANIVFINQTRGSNVSVDVITKSELDRDGDGKGYPGQSAFELKFFAADLRSNQIRFQVQLYISDINDNAPLLQNQPYTWEIDEYYPHGSATFNKVTATDLDSGIKGVAGVRYKIEPKTQTDSEAEDYLTAFSIDEYTGVITLQGDLDYETRNYYLFNVTASDEYGNGTTSVPAILEIKVRDVQDTPPFFTSGSYRAYVYNNVVVNSLVVQVHALDGDIGFMTPNSVNYSILPGPCSDFFSVNNNGIIRTTKPLATDSEAFEPSCKLTVRAEEVDADPSKQYGSTKTNTTVYVIVESKSTSGNQQPEGDCSGGTMLFESTGVSLLSTLIVQCLLK